MERFRYDRSSKWLIEHQGHLILYLGNVRDVAEWRTKQAEVVQPRQLPDGLLEVRRQGQQRFHPYIIEIETYPERRSADDLLDDIMLVYQDRRELPDVLVLVLHPKGNAAIDDSLSMNSRGGLTSLRASWRVVELWKLQAADLLATGEPGLMPWVPLTQIDGPPEPVLRECRRIIDEKAPREQHANLLAVTQVFLGLNYNDSGLFELFGGKRVMIESPVVRNLIKDAMGGDPELKDLFVDIINESPALRDLLAETPHRIVLGILEDRFGAVPPDVKAAITTIHDRGRLVALARSAVQCADLDAFRRTINSILSIT